VRARREEASQHSPAHETGKNLRKSGDKDSHRADLDVVGKVVKLFYWRAKRFQGKVSTMGLALLIPRSRGGELVRVVLKSAVGVVRGKGTLP